MALLGLRYKDFMHFNKEAYALQPLPKRGEMAARKFECAIGLVNNDTKQYISLRNSGNVFTSTTHQLQKALSLKLKCKILLNVICIFLDKKQMAAVMYYFHTHRNILHFVASLVSIVSKKSIIAGR
jgi:hypothetical protein